VKKSNFINQSVSFDSNYSDISKDGGLRYYIILFFIWPLLAAFLSIKNYKKGYTKHVITLFCGFIGAMLLLRSGADGTRYQELFFRISEYSFSDIWLIITDYILYQKYADISRELIFYTISRFSSDPTVLWTTIGLMFGYIYSKNIWYLFEHVKGKININALLFLIAFLFIITPIQGLNQFRFWIAAHIFFYGALNVVMYKRPAYFLISFLAPLFHFGLFLPNLALLLFYFLGRRDALYISLVFISAIFAELEFDLLGDYVAILGPGVEYRFDTYTSERAEYRAEDLQQRSWFMVWWQPLLLYMTYGMMAYMQIKLKKNLTEPLQNFFSFLLILITIFNLVSHFPMIYRYLPVLFLFVFAFFFLYYIHQEEDSFDIAILFCLPPILLMMAIQTRIMFELIDATILISNPIIYLFGISETSLLEFIR